jgi:hypothetical protein
MRVDPTAFHGCVIVDPDEHNRFPPLAVAQQRFGWIGPCYTTKRSCSRFVPRRAAFSGFLIRYQGTFDQ